MCCIVDIVCDVCMIVNGCEIVGFVSNDYFGFVVYLVFVVVFVEGVKCYGFGSGGLYLFGGYLCVYVWFEDEFVGFVGGFFDVLCVLYFSIGYMVNFVVMMVFVGKGVMIFFDVLNYVLLIDGMWLLCVNV